uniref:RING-type domain-containing protein n=1 Tax=Anopheles farauti TaxID=69004 RepID=A0A182QR76_9DIPT
MDTRHDKVGIFLCVLLYVQFWYERTRQYLKATTTTYLHPVCGGGRATTALAAPETETETEVETEGRAAKEEESTAEAVSTKAASDDGAMLDMAHALSLPIDQPDNKHKDEDVACQMSPEYFHIEENRLRTFAQWPVTFIRANVLARYGFYYVGTDDTVKCYFCRVEIGLWEPQDDVIQEHLRWSPYCPLLKKRPTNNVPLAANYLDAVPEPSFDVCGINIRHNSYAENVHDRALDRLSGDSWSGSSEMSVNSSSGGSGSTTTMMTMRGGDSSSVAGASEIVPSAGGQLQQDRGSMTAAEWNNDVLMGEGGAGNLLRRPEYPNYAIEADRLKTYEEWPTSMKQKPQQLSDAGFFYTGKSDRVKCFSCGGGLKDWEQDDEPWEQHAIWYSNCHYLQLMKGREFIQRCNALKEAATSGVAAGTSSGSSSSSMSCSSSQPSTSGISSGSSSLMSTSPASSSGFSSPVPAVDEERTLRCTEYSSSASDDGGEDETGAGGRKTLSDSKICKICFVNEYNTAFLPCGHVVACAKCASSVNKCPLCQQPFINVLRLYLS